MGKYDPLPVGVDPLSHFVPGAVTPSPGDPRDYRFELVAPPAALPPRAMVSGAVRIKNQEQKGSCMTFTGMQCLEHELLKAGTDFDGSEEYGYARIREIDAELCQNVGSYPREVMALLTDGGTLAEVDRPYSADLCTGTTADEQAKAHHVRATAYRVAGSLDAVKAAIVADHKVCFAFTLQKNFQPDANGLIPMPAGGLWGGHAMKGIGYDDQLYGGGYWTENQWGADWGRGGLCFITYAMCALPVAQGGLWIGDTWTFDGALVEQPPVPVGASKVRVQIWSPAAAGGWDQVGVDLPSPAAGGSYYTFDVVAPDGTETKPGGFQLVRG